MKIMLFSATWCGPCQILKKLLLDLEGVDDLNIQKYELSKTQPHEIADKYNVRALPTLVIEEDDGSFVEYRSVSRIYDKIKTLTEINV